MVNRTIRGWYQRHRRAANRFLYHSLLHADDPPHRLAMGMAIGIFVAFTPTVGIQMVIAGFLSWLVRANKAVSMAVVWLSNPATMVPIYWYCYHIGCAILTLEPISREWWAGLADPPAEWLPAVSFYWSRLLQIAGPLWLGGTVVGLVCGYATYYVIYHLIFQYRLRRQKELARRKRN